MPIWTRCTQRKASTDTASRNWWPNGVEFFVLYEDEAPAACGGVQFFGDQNGADEGYGEIKRMYVRPEFRGRGYAKKVLQHLEELAVSKGFSKVAPGNRDFPAGSHRPLRTEQVITRSRRSETTGTTHSASSTRRT